MIVVDLRHVGTTAWLSKVLKISVRTSVSCAAQSFSTRPGMLSGLGMGIVKVLTVLLLLSILLIDPVL